MRKGPPEAVIKFYLFHLSYDLEAVSLLKNVQSRLVLIVFYFLIPFLINCQPHIIDSLLAIKNFLLCLIRDKDGFKPAMPGIADIEISDFFILSLSKLSKILVSLFLNFFLIYYKNFYHL